MNRSTFLGSALGVLLVFSVISYSKTFIPGQDPKSTQQQQTSNQQAGSQSGLESAKQESKASGPASADAATSPASLAGPRPEKTPVAPLNEVSGNAPPPAESFAAPQTYTATAYSLRGRTASGRPVSRGLIAADPSVLPLGTRVRVEAGPWSGEYIVADTGGAVRGRRIDIWTPTAREALQFGRRAVKVTVLSFGVRRGSRSASVRPRPAQPSAPATSTAIQQTNKQEK